MKTKTNAKKCGSDRFSELQKNYQKQKLLIDSIISLLNKYGNTLDLRSLHREFVLTLMGHYLVGDACYYDLIENKGNLELSLAYGNVQHYKEIHRDSKLAHFLSRMHSPQFAENLPQSITNDRSLKPLLEKVEVLAPLVLKEKLLGVVFLGRRISQEQYTKLDLEILDTLCSFSAVTFNNAKLYENAKLSLQEMQRLLDLRNEMISRINHEFRTPLTIIKASLEIIESKGYFGSLYEGISRAISNLEQLIEGLLDLNDKPAEGGPSDGADFNPLPALNALINDYNKKAESKNVRIKLSDTTNSQDLKLSIDRNKFTGIIDVILDNSIKYSSPFSEIVLEVGIGSYFPENRSDGIQILDWVTQIKRDIDEYRSFSEPFDTEREFEETNKINGGSFAASQMKHSKYLILKVKDIGIGIPREDIKYLAQPFRQASNSPDHGVKGKALGLAIAQKIISECNGLLFCKSKEGIGTTFTVYLPIRHH